MDDTPPNAIPSAGEGHSLNDLTDLTGVSQRTVRYYIQQGLLPAAARSGPGARYPEEVLLRLRLIRACQEDGWPLAKVRDHLERLSPDGLSALLDSLEGAGRPRRDASHLRPSAHDDMDPRPHPVRPDLRRAPHPVRPDLRRAPHPVRPDDMVHAAEPNAAQAYLAHLRGLGGGPDLPRAPHPVRPVAPTPAPRRPAAAPLSRANWERITVDTNLELHVRRPLSVAENRRLDKLLEAIEAIYGLQP